jgi:phage shock protein C
MGGVCGGIGMYYDTDPNLIRILWVVLTLLSIGIGTVAYIVAWILIPEELEPSENVIIDAEIVKG